MTSISSESEQFLIGQLFQDPSFVFSAGLDAGDFETALHGRIWGFAHDAAARGSRLTLAAIKNGWPEALSYFQTLADLAGLSPEQSASHVAVVREAARRRKMKMIGQRLMETAEDSSINPDELAAGAVKDLTIAFAAPARGKRHVAASIAESLLHPPVIYSTGMPLLDEVIGGGLVAGKLYGIAARKKVGKTVMLGTISHNLNRAMTPHLFVALEMSPDEIEHRNMARDFGINSMQFLRPASRWLERKVADYATSVPDFTLYEHAPGLSFDDLKTSIMRAVLHRQIKGVIVDYWQLVSGKAKSDTEEYHLRVVAQGLADICRKQGLWCVIAAQLNQDGNTRGGEGLKLACDIYFTLHREKDDDRAWMQMEEARYVVYSSVGTEQSPGLRLNKKGPFFEDVTAIAEVPAQPLLFDGTAERQAPNNNGEDYEHN